MDLYRKLADNTRLLPGEAQRRRDRDRAYMMGMSNENLLRAHYLEAGLLRMNYKPEGIFWGWESPLNDLRGNLVGHWLSAAAHMIQDTGDQEMLLKANTLVAEIGRCQQLNGGRWAFAIPEKMLYRLKEGRHPWAPQYSCHKNMMGLLDMYLLCGNAQALDIVKGCADWFFDFTNDISSETMQDMRDWEETGGIMELWADLYAVTRDERHLTLLRRYERPRLVEPLIAGVDALANMHANATIPELQGYARAYEVTGEARYRRAVEAYWDMAVTKRGMYATGGQTSGEIWSPMGQLAARLGDKTQEHCVVYNMMRLAEYLFRWTGEAKYADYCERNLYNGIFAQGFWQDETEQMIGGDIARETTTVAYYLPLNQGARKTWGSQYDDFWCCHMTLLQANAIHHEGIYYQNDAGLAVAQYLPSQTAFTHGGAHVSLTQEWNELTGGDMMRDEPVNRRVLSRPHSWNVTLRIQADAPARFTLSLRAPAWRTGEPRITVNGEAVAAPVDARGFIAIERLWADDTVDISIGKRLACEALPDDPDMVAFLDGPVCLAGLAREERLLYGDKDNPEGSLLCASDERHWQRWRPLWKAYHQPTGLAFKPLYQIGHERYTVYFPVEKRK